MSSKREKSGVKNESKDGKKNPAKQDKSPSEKKQKETKKTSKDNLQKQLQDLQTENKSLQTELLLRKNDFNIQRVIKDLEKTGIEEENMLVMLQADILAYLRSLQKEVENSNTTTDGKPTDTQPNSLTEEQLYAAKEQINERDKKIIKLENENKKLTDKVKTLEDHNSHSSEQKKTDDNLKEAQKEWENKYNAEVKEKKAAINDLNQMRKKVEDLEAEAKKPSSSSEQEKTIKSLKESQTEWQNKYKAAIKENDEANDKLEKMKKKVERLEAEAKNLSSEATTAQNVGQDTGKDAEFSKIKSLEEQLKEKETEIEQLRTDVETQSKSLEEQLKEKETEIGQLKTNVEKQSKSLKEKETEIGQLKTIVEKQSKDDGLKESYEKLSTELLDVKRSCDEIVKEKETKISQMEKEYKHAVEQKNKSFDEKLKEKETKISQMEKEFKHVVEQKNNEIEKLRKEKSNADSKQGANSDGNAKGLKEKFETVNKELQHAKEEISELKNRLSKVVGAKVMDDNPNITDLSDENRPTKLSEKFSELYDNEWTDAYEESENNNKRETDIIRELYKLLIDINNFCQMLARSHADNIKSSVLSVPSAANGRPPSAVNGRPKTPQIGVTQTRLLKELRKTFAPYLVDSVFQHFVKTKNIDTKSKPKTEKFVKECIKICWLMNAQDPPVVLDTSNVTGNFDDNRFRTYTKSGKTVDYVVWPPLLLHNDGPLLCKGVAQGK